MPFTKRRRCDYVIPIKFEVQLPGGHDPDSDGWDDDASPEETQRELARCLTEELNALQESFPAEGRTVVFAPRAGSLGLQRANAVPAWAALQPESAVPIIAGRHLSKEERTALKIRLDTTERGWTQPLNKDGVLNLLHAVNLVRARLARSLTKACNETVRFSYDDLEFALYEDTFVLDVMKLWPSGLSAMFTRKPDGFLFDYLSSVHTLPNGDAFRLGTYEDLEGEYARGSVPDQLIERRAVMQVSLTNHLLELFGLHHRVETKDIPMVKVPPEGYDLKPEIEQLISGKFPHAEDYVSPSDEDFQTLLDTLDSSNSKRVMLVLRPSARGRRLLQGGRLL